MDIAVDGRLNIGVPYDALYCLYRCSHIVQKGCVGVAEDMRSGSVEVYGAIDSLRHSSVNGEGDGRLALIHLFVASFGDLFASKPYKCYNQKNMNGRYVEMAKLELLRNAMPVLLEEWDYAKNSEICDPESVTIGSSQKIWWKCALGHSFQARIANRVAHKTRCPYCTGRKIIPGFNDFGTIMPHLLGEWNYEKNLDLDPRTLALKSNRKAWWKCAEEHEWVATVASRTSGIGCPYCAGNLVCEGYNDLKTVNPELASEWDYEKNFPLKPEDVTSCSSKKAWWKCTRKHSWSATVANRAYGNGCPKCSKVLKTSFPEQAVSYYLSKHFETSNRDKQCDWEIDIYLPEWSIAIEYDGVIYHEKDSVRKREFRKNSALRDAGIDLIRIKESYDRNDTEDNTIYFLIDTSYTNLDDAITRLLSLVSQKTGITVAEYVDVKRDSLQIKKNYLTAIKEKSLATVCPEIAIEWDYDKNDGLTPDLFTSYSQQKVWWICPLGHSYHASIGNRRSGNGCPICAGREILVGFNDLETKNPILALEWDYELNAPLTPKEVAPHSAMKVWWICKQNHHYEATIAHRASGRSCPYCSGRKVQIGYNDLATVNPTLASEWDYSANGNLRPTQVTANSNRRVGWICRNGHRWKAVIAKRNAGIGCAICSGKCVLTGYNDLSTVHPEIAREWNHAKNGKIIPTEVMPHTMKKVWWLCKKCGHEWMATIDSRSYGHGCPACKAQVLSHTKK